MLFRRPFYFILIAVMFATSFILSGCDKPGEEEETCPYSRPFAVLPEDNNGSRVRSITYVYDRTAVDATYPPKIDSSVILFSYDLAGRIDSMRLVQNDSFLIYDFSFERQNNKLTAIRCKGWTRGCQPDMFNAHLELQYDGAGKVSLMKATYLNDPNTDIDSFIIKSTGNRIDTVIDRTFAFGTNTDKYALTYNGSGDITQMDDIRTSGIFWVHENIFKYTLSGNAAPLVWGDEGIFWHFFARHLDISSNTDFMIPAILFHSAKQPSKLELQVSGIYTGTYNYQTEYYNSGTPKKMTASVITQTGAFYAREAYYYTYAQ
jgi:hypothetical protein